MTEYRVSWTVDIDAGDPIEAAIAAFNMMQRQRDPNDPDAAVVFGVWRSFDADPMAADTIDLADLGAPLEFEDGEWRQTWRLLECDTCGMLPYVPARLVRRHDHPKEGVRGMSKNIVKVWMERVTAEVWEPGVIRQYCTAVMPRSMGYEFGGHRMKMTASEAQDIVEAFDARVAQDGGPLVTPEQANIGIRWLNGQWRRVGMPYLNYSTIDFFRFRDALVFDETAFRAVVGPQYDAYFVDGRVLRYAPTSWMSGNSKFCEWSWVQERSRI